jgi:hypothetical protein
MKNKIKKILSLIRYDVLQGHPEGEWEYDSTYMDKDEVDERVVEDILKLLKKGDKFNPEEIDTNHCRLCGCLYDDKMKGAQGRNGACECHCGHQSTNKM